MPAVQVLDMMGHVGCVVRAPGTGESEGSRGFHLYTDDDSVEGSLRQDRQNAGDTCWSAFGEPL